MIRLGLRLTVNGGREAVVRLIATAVAVSLGVGLLLVTLAAIHAVHTQDVRQAWLQTTNDNAGPSVNEATSDPLWGAARFDQFRAQEVDRFDVAATGPRSPVPPGIARLPAAGEYYASPELSRLIRSTPADQLGARFPGRQVGLIADSALPSPKSLIIVVGRTVPEVAKMPGARQVRSIETAPEGGAGDHSSRMQLILGVAAGALLFPILIFIATATRLAAARREQRFAAMRLVGATPRQVAVVAAVEASVAAVAGVALGFGLFFVLRPALAGVPFTGQPFFPSDLALGLDDALLVALGVPVAAAIAARVALRRVQISPLGVTRRVTPAPPRAWRLLPLLAGLAELAYFVSVGRPSTTSGQIDAFGLGFVLAMVGLVVAGPWLTMVGSRVMAQRARRPSALIAGRRLSDDPRTAFRAVSGLIVAIFVATVSVGVITAIVAYHDASTGGTSGRDVLVAQFDFGPRVALPAAVPDSVDARLRSISGVGSLMTLHRTVGPEPAPAPAPGVEQVQAFGTLVSCAELAAFPSLSQCPPGVAAAYVSPDLGVGLVAQRGNANRDKARPAPGVSVQDVQALPVLSLYVGTDGSTAAIERARTTLEAAFPSAFAPSTLGDVSPQSAQLLAGWRQLASVAIIASLPIAGCSLAVAVAAGLVDRKRPFSLLRLTGAPLAILRRVVALEAALPLLVVAVLSAGTGLAAAHLFLRAQLGESLQPPTLEYYVVVAAGLALSFAVIGSTLPLLDRITGPEVARND